MSKFCGNCGFKMDDDARVCGNCGTPFEGMPDNGVPQKIKLPKTSTMTPEKKKKLKKGLTLGIVAVVAVIAIIVAVNIVSNFTGYKGALRKAMNAIESYDIETLMDVTSDIKFNSIGSIMSADDILSREVSTKLNSYEDEVGHDLHINYSITDSYKLSDRKFQEFTKYVESYYAYDCSDITEVVKVELRIEAKGSSRTKTYTESIYMIKERNKWYYFNGYIGNSY